FESARNQRLLVKGSGIEPWRQLVRQLELGRVIDAHYPAEVEVRLAGVAVRLLEHQLLPRDVDLCTQHIFGVGARDTQLLLRHPQPRARRGQVLLLERDPLARLECRVVEPGDVRDERVPAAGDPRGNGARLRTRGTHAAYPAEAVEQGDVRADAL